MTANLGTGPAQGIGQRTWAKRGIMSILAPLTGARSSGLVVAHATGPDALLPAATYGVPVIQSASGARQLDWTRLVKTAADALVTSAGTSVPIVSMLGGAQMNLPGATEIRWAPTLDGVEASSLLDGAGMTGGVDPTAPGTLRRIVMLDQLGLDRADTGTQAWRARIGAFPAGVLAWLGSERGERVGHGARMRALRFRLYVLAASVAATNVRENEGETVLDYAEALLEDRGAVDGEVLSQPTIMVTGSGAVAAEDGAYVHYLEIALTTTIQRIDARTFATWLAMQQTFTTDVTDDYPDPDDALVVADLEVVPASS